MKSTPNLTFETLENQAGFILTASSNYVSVILPDAPKDYNIGHTTEALILMVSEEIRATAFNADDSVVLYLTKENSMPQSFSLLFDNIVNLDVENNQIVLNVTNMKIFIDITDCSIVAHESTSVTLLMNNSEAQISFSINIKSVAEMSSQIQNVSLLSIDGGRMLIPSSRRIPEFIISIYDDSDCVRPRPSRFGVPVISTVPGFIPDDSWGVTVPQEDKDLMELGVGASLRKMYFRMISDQTIESSIRDNVTLEIDLPAGVDTVVETVSIPVTYVNSYDINDVFSGSYEFHKEDTVNFVDGFAYLSVRLPLRIQRNLPLTFQVSTDGSPFEDVVPILSEDVSVDALSVETNVVQPKLTNSTQVLGDSKGKKKKNGSKPKI